MKTQIPIRFTVHIEAGYLSMRFPPGDWERLLPEDQASFRQMARELGKGTYAESSCLSAEERERIITSLVTVMTGGAS